MVTQRYDVVVIGAGNAALSAALSAQENGARVLVLERAPQKARGGNSYFTGGLVRFPYHGLDDIRSLIPDMSDTEAGNIEVGEYTEEQFFETIGRVTEYMADAELTGLVVAEAFPTMVWLKEKGVRFALATGRQAFKTESGKFRFWGGAPVEIVGGGIGLVDMLFDSAQRHDIEVWYGARAYKLLTDEQGRRVTGVAVRKDGEDIELAAGAVILACGGFEANPEMRAKYLGPGWDLVKVRGTEFNTGDGINMALNIGAQPFGNWSGCHAVAWDLNAPTTGDRKVGESYQKHSYPFGVVVNRDGKRFIDEGADFRNYTYAKYGKEILKQPGYRAVQIFDAKVTHLLRDEYRIPQVTKFSANTIEELAEGLEINPQGLAQTIREFNEAVMQDVKYDPTVKDGKGTIGVDPPKTNWALPIDTPPFVGFAVTGGITFTFGGLRVSPQAEVLDMDNAPIAGLYAAGELVGGLFYHNYPGGTGLVTGSIFGKIAGAQGAAVSGALRS